MFVATLLIAAPEEASPPLIDVDGTLFVQFALFVLMLIVLSRLRVSPVPGDARRSPQRHRRRPRRGVRDAAARA